MNELQKYLKEHVFVDMKEISKDDLAALIVDEKLSIEEAYRLIEMNVGTRPFWHYFYPDDCVDRKNKIEYVKNELSRFEYIMENYLGYRKRHGMRWGKWYYSPNWFPKNGIHENILYIYNKPGTFSEYSNANRIDESYAVAGLNDAELKKYKELMCEEERHTVYDDTCGYGGGHHTPCGRSVYARAALEALIKITNAE